MSRVEIFCNSYFKLKPKYLFSAYMLEKCGHELKMFMTRIIRQKFSLSSAIVTNYKYVRYFDIKLRPVLLKYKT